MKNKKNLLIIIFILIFVCLIASISILFVKFDEEEVTIEKNITMIDFLNNIEDTEAMNYLLDMYETTYEINDNNFVVNIKNVDETYEFSVDLLENVSEAEEYSYELSFKVDKNNTMNVFVFIAMMDSIYQNYGYESGSLNFIHKASDYILNQMGITASLDENMVYSYVVDVSNEYAIPEDVSYISYANLEYNRFQTQILTDDYFVLSENNVSIFKEGNSNLVTILIKEEDELTQNSYNTLLTLINIVLEDEYENFLSNYTELKDYQYSNINIDVEYEVTENDLDCSESAKYIKLEITL